MGASHARQGNGLQIAKLGGPRIFMSEGRQDVEITGFEGDIVISLSLAVLPLRNHYFRKALRHKEFRTLNPYENQFPVESRHSLFLYLSCPMAGS